MPSRPEPAPLITIDDVRAAAARLAGVAHRTPVVTSRTLDAMTGHSVLLKAESLQRVGAFKFRGAYNRISTLTADQLAAGVVAVSSGNHAQAVALSARLCGTRAVILMPTDAPTSKLAATRGYGAEVVEFDRWTADREQLLASTAAERGLTIVHPYDDPYVMAGQGTAVLELIEDAGPLDALLVCLGGGGLLAGSATVAKALNPSTWVVGVEPTASDDWQRSFAAGHPVRVEVGPSIADGQLTPQPGRLTWPVVSALADEIVTVTDDEIAVAVRFCFERLNLVVEPSGASALAALLGSKVSRLTDGGGAARRIGITLSGGNVDAARFAKLIAPG